MPLPLDPGHAAKRKKLGFYVKAALGLSFALGIVGAALLLTSVVADSFKIAAFCGFAGILVMGASGFLFTLSLPVAFFAFSGSMFRYQAEEVVPVAEDVARRGMGLREELAPREAAVDEKIAEGIARGARRGWEEGARK